MSVGLRADMPANGSNDTLTGGAGDDLLVGGAGRDRLVGGFAANAPGEAAREAGDVTRDTHGEAVEADATSAGAAALPSGAVDDYFLQTGSGLADIPNDLGTREEWDSHLFETAIGTALIKAVNGGTGHQLGDWLAATLPNIFGANASGSDLAGQGNAAVAALFQSDFLLKGVKLDAQVLATALSVYVTNATLDPTQVAAQYGFKVSGNGAGTATVSIGFNGDAFGVANNTVLTVMDLLLATDEQAVNGVLYNGNAPKRNEANNVYSAVNQAGNIS